jgi:putative polyketide hydroxylase
MTPPLSPVRVPVLILGGGVVGLSAALLLLHHGVRPLLVERHPGTSIHPRSRGINARSGEIFRQIGVFDEIEAAGSALQPAGGILRGESLFGALAQVPRRSLDAPDAAEARRGVGKGMAQWTPTPSARCTQDILEPILRARALERGGDLRFATQLDSFTQDDDGVTAWLVDRTTGARTEVRADYLIAADGVKGDTRERIGIGASGPGAFGDLLNVLLEVDLADFVQGREPSQVMIENDEVSAVLVSIDNRSRWALHIVYRPDQGQTAAHFPPERCQQLARAALGLPDVPIEVVGILPWQPSVRIAERLRTGRVFLAGDAAHEMPPWGGQGANSGIAEVHNLAWKLSAVLRGTASASLLDTYESERLPIGRFAAERSGDAAGRHGLPRVGSDGAPAALETMGRMFLIGFGYVYGEPEDLGKIESFDGRVGSRVPHAWIESSGARSSTLDLFGRGFVLVGRGAGWNEAVRALAESDAIALEMVTVGEKGTLGGADAWAEEIRLTEGNALLVRPDGFVAWRSDTAPGGEPRARELRAAVLGALGRG